MGKYEFVGSSLTAAEQGHCPFPLWVTIASRLYSFICEPLVRITMLSNHLACSLDGCGPIFRQRSSSTMSLGGG